jgi:RNA polymerase sigma factor (sigma-70 family)
VRKFDVVTDNTSLDQNAFEVWYEREHARMIVTLLLATGDLDLAAESVDEACARALAKWDRVGAMDAPTGWVYSVSLNHARRLARRKGLERSFLPRLVSPANMPPEASEIWELVADLPERQRQVIVLRHVGNLKEVDIAEILQISRSTVSTTLRDAHTKLSALLDDRPEENFDETKEIADV